MTPCPAQSAVVAARRQESWSSGPYCRGQRPRKVTPHPAKTLPDPSQGGPGGTVSRASSGRCHDPLTPQQDPWSSPLPPRTKGQCQALGFSRGNRSQFSHSSRLPTLSFPKLLGQPSQSPGSPNSPPTPQCRLPPSRKSPLTSQDLPLSAAFSCEASLSASLGPLRPQLRPQEALPGRKCPPEGRQLPGPWGSDLESPGEPPARLHCSSRATTNLNPLPPGVPASGRGRRWSYFPPPPPTPSSPPAPLPG